MKEIITGRIFIISAPSGTGKSSLLRALIKKKGRNMKLSISYTTRKIRSHEKDKKNYFFINMKKFQNMINNNDFLEYASVFGNYYGTSKKFVIKNIRLGYDILLEIDWQGAQRVLKKIPSSRSIFILPPCKETLQKRLLSRNQDDKSTISLRMQNVAQDIKNGLKYHYIVINDNFELALEEIHHIICSEHLRSREQILKNYNLIHEFFLQDDVRDKPY
ncbi:guanylate kinase [Candidatus Riesia pediculischaeffi]|uniref:Guanylate kinase n=1 Tax=Candidatus Riesia pediculischaeffi TaxID=428411 RepID=A0A1V0HKP5_9ENTR|nr:guanylate kinase [Candidatus Riesia pediculischaeffi]ARC53417.1 hypothetical protein AOQ87_02000 [Candidatus Riesia pediculischaeffi]